MPAAQTSLSFADLAGAGKSNNSSRIEPLLYDELHRRQQSFFKSCGKLSVIHLLHQRAMNGDLEGIHQLSELYQTGNKVPEDQYLAFRLLRFAAEQGYEPAFSSLGKCYAYGIGTQKHPEEALRWFLQTDYSNDVNTLAFLAWSYRNGVGVPQDEQKAYSLWIDAAEKGHSDGFQFCQIAANAGDARGQFTLGHFYQCGLGTPVDIPSALHWFHKAADQNYSLAQCRLGILYDKGEYGIESDPVVAVQWLRLAAAQNDSVACYRLAYCLAYGDAMEQNGVKNTKEAVQIWKKLAQKSLEFPKGDPASQYSLGTLLTHEEYAGYNPKESIKWLRKSAEQGYMSAQTALGVLYYNGYEDFAQPDWKRARHWLRKAALQGDNLAQYYFGELYYSGNGVRENHKEAFQWYKKSSENGYVPALQRLAHCYLHGIGTRKNEEEGYRELVGLALWGHD